MLEWILIATFTWGNGDTRENSPITEKRAWIYQAVSSAECERMRDKFAKLDTKLQWRCYRVMDVTTAESRAKTDKLLLEDDKR